MNILIFDSYKDRGESNLFAFKSYEISAFFIHCIDPRHIYKYHLNHGDIEKCKDESIPLHFSCVLLHYSDKKEWEKLKLESNLQYDNIVFYTADINMAPISPTQLWIKRSISKDTLLTQDALDIINWCKDESQIPRLFSSGFPLLTSLLILCQAYLYLSTNRNDNDYYITKARLKMKIFTINVPSNLSTESDDVRRRSWWLSIFNNSDESSESITSYDNQDLTNKIQSELKYEWSLKCRSQRLSLNFTPLENLIKEIVCDEVDPITVAKAFLSISI
jgi:hypothetical protein